MISPTRWRLRLSVLRRCSVRNCAFPHLEPLKVRGCGQRPSPLPLSSRHAGEDLLSALQLRVPAGSVEEIERHLDRGRDTNPFEGRWPSPSTSSTATSSRSPLPIRKAVAASTERAVGMPMSSPRWYFLKPYASTSLPLRVPPFTAWRRACATSRPPTRCCRADPLISEIRISFTSNVGSVRSW